MDSGLLAEPVIGPATSGRTRWLGPGMTALRAAPPSPIPPHFIHHFAGLRFYALDLNQLAARHF